MTDGHGRWIVFNGEIFNFIELREELKSLGSRFRTETDTEVILQIYDKFGETGFSKMNGMWALAIADLHARRVVLSRDRFSIKPLYLLNQDNALFFASEIKQLLPLLSKKVPNFGILSTFIAQGLLDHSLETFFCGISRVPAKTNVVVHLNDARVVPTAYWEYRRQQSSSPANAQEEFRALLIDSTRIRLRSDVKVGLLLSGGLDSSALAVASSLSGGRDLETYSVVSDDPHYSEEPFIDSVNQSLGSKSIKFRFQQRHFEEMLSEVLHHSDEPVGGLSVVAQYGMFRNIRTHSDATVLLSGQGGDEVLLGYLKFFFYHLRDLVLQGQYVTAVSQVVFSAIRRTVVRQFRLSEARRYMPFWGRKSHNVLRGMYTPVSVWANRGMQSRQIADIDLYSVPALTHYEDRNSMAHSLEVRHPFLDHRIVDLALSFPPELQFCRGWTKNLLRESFPELPDFVRWRKDKQYFTTPEEHWLKGELAAPIERTFRRSLLDEMGLLDSKFFLKQFSAFRRGDPLVSFGDISRPFIAELWAQQQWNSFSDQFRIYTPRFQSFKNTVGYRC